MAGRHSREERQRLKNMLSDAVRVLCQNTVKYDVQLCIEAVIGITVDGGKDALIVSLNEQIGKQAADTTCEKERFHDVADDSPYADAQAEYMEDETGEYLGTADDDEEYDSSEQSCVPYGTATVVKQELMSTITYSNVGRNCFQPAAASASAVTNYQSEPYVDKTETEQYYDEPQNIGYQHSWSAASRPSANVFSKSQTGAQKRPKFASTGVKKAGRFVGKVSAGGSGQQKPTVVGKSQSLNGEDAVAQITLYTCGTCGAQMQHHASFLRHKKSHTEQHTFRCEGCGKMIRRHDNLITHQRRCSAYHSLLLHSDPGI